MIEGYIGDDLYLLAVEGNLFPPNRVIWRDSPALVLCALKFLYELPQLISSGCVNTRVRSKFRQIYIGRTPAAAAASAAKINGGCSSSPQGPIVFFLLLFLPTSPHCKSN